MHLFLSLIILLFSCYSQPPKPIIMPPTKQKNTQENLETVYSLGYLSDYDIWEFLTANPSELEVIEMFGYPDSVWLDDYKTTKYLYYYIAHLQDYNTIEISAKSDTVSGFEWD